MSDSSGASVADDAETRDSSDYEVLHDDKLKDTINNFLKDDSDCDSSYETQQKKKNDRFPIETIKGAGSQSERTETEISADDVRDMVSEESRGSEFSRSNDEYRRQRTNRLSSRSESDSDGGCSDVSTKSRNKKSEKNMKLCQKSSYRENKSSYDNCKLFRGEKSLNSDKKKHHSSQSHSSSKKLQQDGSKLKKHQHSLSHPNDRKSFTNVGQQLSRSDKSVREKVKAGVEDRRTPSESKGTKSRAVDVRDVWSEEDSRTSELSDNSASNGSCQGGGAETPSIASRISDDERSSPCNSTSSHDFNTLQRKDLKTSSDSDRKSRLDAVMSHHTKKSGASVDRSRQGAKSHNHEEKSIHSKSKSQDSRLDFSEKKLHHGDVAPRGSNGKQPPGCGKSIKKEDVPTKTSQMEGKTGTKARSATRKTAETDNSTDGFNEIVSENSRTSDLWAGFALGDWGHGRATDRLSIASNSDVDEVSSLCGSAESRGKLRTKELKKSSDAESKLRHGDRKSHHSDKSRESDKKSWHSDKLHTTDKKSHHSSNDKSQPGGKSLNSSSKESLGAERPAGKDESILNTGGLQKSPRGLSFFSSSKNAPYVTHSSTYKAPNVKTTAVSHKITNKTDAATHADDSPPVFTKVKINGFRVFIDKTLRTDPKLWQLLDVTLVNCDHVLAASLAKQRETLARKTECKGKRENENDAGKILVNKHTSSSKSRQSDEHARQKSFDKTRSEGSDGHKQSNNKKSSKDSNKKSKDRSKSQGESRLLDSSISRSALASDVRHESKSHNSRKELHERKSNSGSKSQRDSESNNSSKSQRERESNSNSKSQREESNQSSKSQRESESNSSDKSQRESESNHICKSQRESESNQSSKSQRESESKNSKKSQRESESKNSKKSQCESESNQSSKSQRESESNSNIKSQREESNQSSKSQRESESNNSCKSQCEIESNSIGKSQRERESNSISKSQRESESKNSKKSKRESESKNSSKSQHESESNQSSKVQRESESNSKSKSQLEKESNVSIKSQRESESNSNSKSERESEPNISSKSQQDRKSNQSSKSQRENHSNHRSNSKHGSESQQTGKSHSKIKSNQSDRSHHDSKSSSLESKSSSLESKSLGRSALNSNELQPSPSGSLADKELKIKESKSQSSFRAESSLHDKSNQNCRKKTTADVKTAAEQLKPTKKRINIFQSDSDDDGSTIDSKENTMKKEHHVFKEDSKPVCDNSKHGQIVADDLGLLSSDEKSKDDILPEKEQHQNADELKADAKTEEDSDADDSSSRHDETADIEHASTDTCSASVKTEINDSVSEGLVKQAELESAKEISVPSSDAPLELCKSEENSATDLEDIKKKPESDQCSDLTKTDETDQPSVCQTTCRSDMSDGKDVDHLKNELLDDPQFSKASGLSELDQIASDDRDEDSVTVVQDLRGAGDCVMPREGLQSSNSDNGLVPSIERASSVVSTEAATKVSGTEPVTKVLGKVPLCAQSYNLEEVKKDVRMQPFVKLKILDEAVLKKLLSDWEHSVRRKSLDTAAAKVVSSLALDSVTHSRSSSSSSSSGRSEIKDRCMDKNMPPTGDKEVKENKKRSISSSDDISAAEPPARRLKVESDVKSELVNSDKKKESGSALPETIAKSLQKAKAEFKRKGGFPSEMVRDDVKKRKTDADRNIAGMESWMRGGRDDKKMNSLSFVIPKVKSEQKADRVKKKKPQERPEKVWLPPPTAIPVPRIPKPAPLPKTLTEEDKGRSVLAKLEDTAGESENLRWQTNDSNYRGKNAVRASNWQPFNSMDDRGKRFGPQEGPHRRNCSPGMPIDVVNGSTGSSRFQRWNAGSNTGNPRNPSDTPFGGSSSNTPRLPAPSRWHGAQPPTHSVTNEKGGSSSSDWVRLYNRDPLRLEDPSAADECSAAFSPPAVADDEDDDIPNDRTITPRKVSTDDGDNMVENVKVLAEAIQEVLVEGTISSGRRDKLVDIYAKLQRDLNLTSDMQQGNVSLLNAFCGSTNQTLMSVDMFKDLLQHGSTPSQPDSASTLLNLPPSANESARNDFALMAARDFDFRDGSRVPMGYQDVDHRRIDVRCNPVRGFEKMVLSSTPVSSLVSPRGSVTGKSDSEYGSHPLPISTTGASRSAASHGGRGFRIDPNATFMDIDERNKCSQDIDERSAWARTTAERELAIPVITNVMRGPANLDVLQTPRDSDSVFGSPRTAQPDGIKTLEKAEVPKSKETLRQEAIASRIEDELQLLEMLVTIQCELAEVSPVPETSSETTAADVAEPTTPVPEQALNTSDTIPSGISSAVSNSPMCAGSVRSPVAEEASQDSTTHLSCKETPQQKGDDEPKAADSAKAVEDRVISLARNALKPFYHKSQITSEEFKLIMRKAIAKIKVRDGEELKESKVSQLINAYVENIIRRRKKVSL